MSINPKNLPEAVNNQSLFSDYYLDSLIVEQSQWADTPNIESDYPAIKQLFDTVAPNAELLNESQTERGLIQPVLERLGHFFEVQPTLHTSQGSKVPDYAFFASQDAHDEAQSQINTNEFFKTALAVGDAKAWSRNLDRRTQARGDPFNNQNPNYQIDFYLRGADKNWGILTNGRQWRLYHRQTSYRLDRFYEVDLAALLGGSPDLETFRYFYCLFRRDAFTPDPSGTSFIDLVLGESQQYTVNVSNDLKNRIYDALRLLIVGFLDFPRNRFDKTNPPLHEIHTNCLILLYRVLFTLYAESRGLLPIDNPNYAAHYSLAALAETIHESRRRGDLIIPTISDYWARMRGLFTLINEGWDELIPQYNGGLFNPGHHSFLEQYELGNDSLTKVIELLTRTEEGERITYRDLDVRHLGDIYEGLLEFQLQIADQDLVIVSKKKRESVAPKSSPKQEVAYRAGEIYLLTNKGERKATGSYYTPDYIVRYIVENTLAPLCEGKTVEEILSLKILDPATGSGHFLVGVVDYLAEELITHPGAAYMTETGSEETELAYWRRRVVESCIYGVDLNPMAVELAKLSLWLHTVAKGEPLSFLDHHIRCGNSLIGAKIENLSNLPQLKKSRRETGELQTGELSMAFPFTDTVATAIGHYLLIEKMESRTADQIHAKEHELDIAQTMLRFHKGMANLWTSVYFGNHVSRTDYNHALKSLRSKKTHTVEDLLSYRRAQEIAAEKRFFHWEIEFPEVFRDKFGREKDNPGFDAVVGNPPYVSAWSMTESDIAMRAAIKELNSPLLGAHWDLYVPFLLSAHRLTKEQGRFSFIIPNPFCREKYATEIRRFLLARTCIERIMSFGEENIFEEVARQTLVPIFLKSNPDWNTTRVQIDDPLLVVQDPSSYSRPCSRETPQIVFYQTPGHQIRHEVKPQQFQILHQIDELTILLGNVCYVNYGAQVSSRNKGEFGKAQMISYFPLQNSKKFFEGKNLSRYNLHWSGLYLNYQPEVMYGPRAPKLFENPKLVIRKISGENDSLLVTLDEENLYCDDGLVLAVFYDVMVESNLRLEFEGFKRLNDPYNLKYLLAITASRLTSFYYGLRFATGSLQGTFSHVYPQHVRNLPIRRINFTTSADQRDCQLEKAKTLYQFCLDKESIDCVLGFVNHHLAADPQRADIVHDLLAFLAEQMVEMNKTKGQEIRGFLHWLELEIGVEIEAIKNKTAIRSYFDLPFDRLLDVLRKNRRSIAVDLSSRNFQESLKREFTASLAKLKPLLTRIQVTDALIDQVVYQLYGLTDEEIAVVEGEA